MSALLLATLLLPAQAGGAIVLETRTVRGGSMEPLFKDGQRVRILRGYYAVHPVGRGDVVVYSFASDKSPIIKTVKAVAGDRFSLKRAPGGAWTVLINGRAARNSRGVPYALSSGKLLAAYEESSQGVVPKGACLLFGETPEGSFDSSRIGLVSVGDIAGKVDGLILQ